MDSGQQNSPPVDPVTGMSSGQAGDQSIEPATEGNQTETETDNNRTRETSGRSNRQKRQASMSGGSREETPDARAEPEPEPEPEPISPQTRTWGRGVGHRGLPPWGGGRWPRPNRWPGVGWALPERGAGFPEFPPSFPEFPSFPEPRPGQPMFPSHSSPLSAGSARPEHPGGTDKFVNHLERKSCRFSRTRVESLVRGDFEDAHWGVTGHSCTISKESERTASSYPSLFQTLFFHYALRIVMHDRITKHVDLTTFQHQNCLFCA